MHKWLLVIVSMVLMVGLRQTVSAAGGCGVSLEFWAQEAARAQTVLATGDEAAAEEVVFALDEQFLSQLDDCDLLTFDSYSVTLKQTASARDGSYSLLYPSDWQTNESPAIDYFVGLGSTVALMEALQAGEDLRAFGPGEIVVGVLVGDMLEGVADAPIPAEQGGYADVLRGHLEAVNLIGNAGFDRLGLAEYLYGDQRGAMAVFDRGVSDGVSRVAVILFPLADGVWARVFATYGVGETSRVLPTLLGVARSITLAESTTSAPETDLLPEGVLTRYMGMTQPILQEGMYALGDPEARVTLTVYSSFACPPCATFNQDVSNAPEILDYVREGRLLIAFVPYYTTGHLPNGEDAARAAVCAGEQGRFFEMKDVLFSWQTLSEAPFSEANFSVAVNGLGLDEDTFFTCMGSPQTTAALEAALALGAGAGVIGTPTVLINNRVMEDRTLDGVLAMIETELGVS